MELLGLEWWQVLIVLLAGFWAGTINSVVGSGTLVTFPTLVAVGFPPVTAQMSNAIGLVAAGFSGTWGYRRELREAGTIARKLTWGSLAGGLIGATLLMQLPATVFEYAAPILIVFAILFVVFQPRLNAWVRRRRVRQMVMSPSVQKSHHCRQQVTPALFILVFLRVFTAVFRRRAGVLLMGILGVFMTTGTLVHANAIKTWLSLAVNLIAATGYLFAFDRITDCRATHRGIITDRRLTRARIGRHQTVLRMVIVIVGIMGIINMVLPLTG